MLFANTASVHRRSVPTRPTHVQGPSTRPVCSRVVKKDACIHPWTRPVNTGSVDKSPNGSCWFLVCEGYHGLKPWFHVQLFQCNYFGFWEGQSLSTSVWVWCHFKTVGWRRITVVDIHCISSDDSLVAFSCKLTLTVNAITSTQVRRHVVIPRNAVIGCNICASRIFSNTLESLQLLHAGIAARCMQ